MNDPINIELSAAYVEFGGNTGNDEYFYAFNKKTLIFTKKGNSIINITFSQSTPNYFKIYSFICNDNSGDISRDKSIVSLSNNVILKNRNSRNQSINISLIIYDEQRGVYFSCDPQVLNSPDLE